MRRSAASKYEVRIWWSDEDRIFVAEAPELPGCMAHGKTRDTALANLHDAMHLWLDTAREQGRAIPEPQHHLAAA